MYYKLKQSNELCHYGTKGQRWGDRKYQYEDGSLTPEGKIHYGVGNSRKGSSFKSSNTSNKRYNGNSYKKSNVKKNRSNIPSKKPDLSKYNTNKKVKDISKDDKTFIQKANEFFGSPVGKIVSSIALTMIGVGIKGIASEMKSSKKKEMKSPGIIDDVSQKTTYSRHNVNLNNPMFHNPNNPNAAAIDKVAKADKILSSIDDGILKAQDVQDFIDGMKDDKWKQ